METKLITMISLTEPGSERLQKIVWQLYDSTGALAGHFYKEDDKAVLVSKNGKEVRVPLTITMDEAIKILLGQIEYIT